MQEQNMENRFSGMSREEILREARKQILHSALLALAALVVIGIACYAWFVSSGTVTANVGKVTLGEYGFDLATQGQIAKLDATMPADYTVPEGENYAGTDWKWTTIGKQTIQWGMTGDANLGNLEGEDGYMDGIRPGTSGKLSFYVIPREDGPLRIQFKLTLVPMKEKETLGRQYLVQQGDVLAQRLLQGHLLFAYPQQGDTGNMALVDYQSGSFTIDFGTVTRDVPIPVTLKWFWPMLLSDAKGDADFGTTIAGWIAAEPGWFLYPDGDDQTGAAGTESDRYNSADYYIGESIDAIVLRLNGDKAT